jgi:hypothetical protein
MTGSPGTRPSPDMPPGPRAALVIATTGYHDPELRRLRAPAQDALALAEVLGDPGIGGFDITSVTDAEERDIRRAIDVFLSAREVSDMVLVYLSCHGLLDRRNRLYFAAADTAKNQLGGTAIPAAWLLDQMEDCRARQQVLILDCCFSGAFTRGSKGDAELDLERRLTAPGRGRAVLTASRAGEYSFEGQALPGAAISGSVFTTGLVEGLRTGAADVGGDGYVSVDEAYDYALRYVQSSGVSQTPQRWLSGGEGAIVLTRSPAGAAVAPAVLPEDLAASLESRYPGVRVGAVHELSGWLASGDPARTMTAERTLRQIADTDNATVAAAARAYLADLDQPNAPSGDGLLSIQKSPEPEHGTQARTTRLLADAERTAQSITDKYQLVHALSVLSVAMKDTDPKRSAQLRADAERIAMSITDPEQKTTALLQIEDTTGAVTTEPPERIARSIRDKKRRELILGVAAETVAATDPDRAERIAGSITDHERRARKLAEVAVAVAPRDQDRSRRLAHTAASATTKEEGLADVAETLASIYPDMAEHIARSITDPEALGNIAKAMAVTSPDRAAGILANAERAARARDHDDIDKALALTEVARAAVVLDPGRAIRLLDEAERAASSETDRRPFKAWALGEIAEVMAAVDPQRAERLAHSISRDERKAQTLHHIVETIATTDPDRAELIARSITDQKWKDRALRHLVAAIASTDPDRAERIAQSITDEDSKEYALSEVAAAVAANDPDRAERIAQSLTDPRCKVLSLLEIAKI